MEHVRTLLQAIAQKIEYLKRCESASQYAQYTAVARDKLDALVKLLPSGSGIDAGTKLDWERSTEKRIVLTFGFHHMNEGGYYDGWTEHTAVITPAFIGFDLKITGRDRNQIKEYLYDTYDYALKQRVNEQGELSNVMDATA